MQIQLSPCEYSLTDPTSCYCSPHVMSVSTSPSRVSLPSIEEMFPERLLGLPERPRHCGEPVSRVQHVPADLHMPPKRMDLRSYDAQAPQAPMMSRTTSAPAYSKYADALPPQDSAFQPPFSTHDPRALALEQHVLAREDDRRHMCETCGKAFNRPSSLAIHVNTHTGAKPFVCPFPGCGRRFNVNSNMRRHLRNHSSPSARSNNLTPYTYPLTTVPRNYNFNTSSSSITSSHSPSSSVSSSPRVSRHVQLTDSEEESDPSSYWDGESDVEEARDSFKGLRLRSRSSPGVRRPSHSYEARSPENYNLPLGRSRSRSCTQPGCQCRLPAALHPSDSTRHMSK